MQKLHKFYRTLIIAGMVFAALTIVHAGVAATRTSPDPRAGVHVLLEIIAAVVLFSAAAIVAALEAVVAELKPPAPPVATHPPPVQDVATPIPTNTNAPPG
jgi:hypothetical protein